MRRSLLARLLHAVVQCEHRGWILLPGTLQSKIVPSTTGYTKCAIALNLLLSVCRSLVVWLTTAQANAFQGARRCLRTDVRIGERSTWPHQKKRRSRRKKTSMVSGVQNKQSTVDAGLFLTD